jgi:hypothetical protein
VPGPTSLLLLRVPGRVFLPASWGQPRFQLGDSGHLGQHELANGTSGQGRKIADHHAGIARAFHDGEQEASVACQAINLGDDQRGAARAAASSGRLARLPDPTSWNSSSSSPPDCAT